MHCPTYLLFLVTQSLRRRCLSVWAEPARSRERICETISDTLVAGFRHWYFIDKDTGGHQLTKCWREHSGSPLSILHNQEFTRINVFCVEFENRRKIEKTSFLTKESKPLNEEAKPTTSLYKYIGIKARVWEAPISEPSAGMPQSYGNQAERKAVWCEVRRFQLDLGWRKKLEIVTERGRHCELRKQMSKKRRRKWLQWREEQQWAIPSARKGCMREKGDRCRHAYSTDANDLNLHSLTELQFFFSKMPIA